ncbi:hypothetical protein UNDKW_4527 [Undibacterium sp. KW1]|nr:hypothetical protein UNDKW_4527 [Undibacterium sp. KW1]
MQMFRHDNHGDDFEGVSYLYCPECISQRVYVVCEELTLSVLQIDREKVSSTGDIGAAIAHGIKLERIKEYIKIIADS